MKKSFLLFLAGILSASFAFAAKEIKSGEFTVVKNQVEHTSGTTKSPAKPKDLLEEKSVVQTGAASLTELGFSDASVLRLGSNTQFSFQAKERLIKLDGGAILMNVPPGNGGITVDGGGVTGAVSGTTLMASRDEQGNLGFMVLEGQGGGKVIGKDGVPVDIIAGQIAIARQDGKPTQVMQVSVDMLRDLSPLFADFPGPLPGSDLVQITTDAQAQDVQNEIGLLQSPKDLGMKTSDPILKALAMLAGLSSPDLVAGMKIFVGDSTAAGSEGGGGPGSSASLGIGGGSLVAFNDSAIPVDARQEAAASLLATTMLVSSGGLGDESTAAGGEGDLSGTDTAAGGGGGADTQSPLPPVVSRSTPAQTTPN